MPTPHIEDLFRPRSASIRQLVSDFTGGFAIPQYQRPYRWDPEDIRRLIEDVIHGIDRIAAQSEGVSFIGTIITVAGVSGQHSTTPREATQVIDGQQRLSTILMIMIAVREQLPSGLPFANGLESQPDLHEWLAEQVTEARHQLGGCLAERREAGEDPFRRLPKIIRDIDDRWANRPQSARYISPIAHLLHSYLVGLDDDSGFVLTPPSAQFLPASPGSSIEDHKNLQLRYKQIEGYLKQVARGLEKDIPAHIDVESALGGGSSVMQSLFPTFTPDSGPELSQLALDNAHIAQPIRLLIFARFLLDRVVLTQINAQDEAYAFDLFDQLNTTGEPLTAFETFLPSVVREEGQSQYYQSESYRQMSTVSTLLGSQASATQKTTARLITIFMLAEAGRKIPEKHNDQRRFLAKRYRDQANTIQERRAMTRQLEDTALTYLKYWPDAVLARSVDDPAPVSADGATAFCLRFLDSINHTVTIAPLSRYVARWRTEPRPEGAEEIFRLTRAITAFSTMWRAAHGGTDGIDSRFRALMNQGVEGIVAPIGRTKADSHQERPLPAVRDVIRGLREILASAENYAFSTKEEWVELAGRRPIYDEQRQLARLLLLLAAHHAAPDGATGLTKDAGAADHLDMLSAGRWEDDRLATVEHVAPQAPADPDDWDPSCYSQPDTIHRLGNLTLVPIEENIWVSNRNWEEKRVLYDALSETAPDDAEAVLREASERGIEFSEEFKTTIHERRRPLPILRAVALFDGTWNAEFIQTRSRNLLSRAWSLLSSWLEYEEEH